MSSEVRFKDVPFGFSSPEEFADRVRHYINELREDSALVTPEELTSTNERLRERLTQILASHQLEISTLEERLQDPIQFYLYVLSIYRRIVILEEAGNSKRDIAKIFWNESGREIFALHGLLENGIRQTWGYVFMQICTAHSAGLVNQDANN